MRDILVHRHFRGKITRRHPMATRNRFPHKLLSFLEDTTEDDGIFWDVTGEQFVWNVQSNCQVQGLLDKCSKHFQHQSLDSIRRQMNLYGFKRNKELKTYYHPDFRRHSDTSHLLRRSSSSGNLRAQGSSGRTNQERAVSSLSLLTRSSAGETEHEDSDDSFSELYTFFDKKGVEDRGKTVALLSSSPVFGNSQISIADTAITNTSSPSRTTKAMDAVRTLEAPFTVLGSYQDVDVVTAGAGLFVRWEGQRLPARSLLQDTPPLREVTSRDGEKLAFLDTSKLPNGRHHLVGNYWFEVVSVSSMLGHIKTLVDPLFNSTISMGAAFRKLSYKMGRCNSLDGSQSKATQATVSVNTKDCAFHSPRSAD